MSGDQYYYQQRSQRRDHAQSSQAAGQPSSHSRPEREQLPIDPALSTMYPSYYPQYENRQQQRSLPVMHSSPSDASDSIASPNTDISNMNGKRSAQSAAQDNKRPRKDDPPGQSLSAEKDPPPKPKSTRGSRKHELLTRSLRKMERTLDTVLRSISNPGMSAFASGMVSRSPSPSAQSQAAHTQALLNSPSPPPSAEATPSVYLPSSPKLHSLPDNDLNPLGLLADASLANRRAHIANNPSSSGRMLANSLQPEDSQNIGVASDVYFKPVEGPMTILPLRRLYIERQIQPEMLNFVSTPQVVDLFNIYFEYMNPHCNLLEKDLHTPSFVCSRSPFLLTTICAIASKFYTPKPELHPRLNTLAKSLAFSVPERGYKSVEIVQAYLLLSLWGCGPVERYEQDKTWLLLGMGIRMATDLNLHRKSNMDTNSASTDEERARAREILNRERTWLLCFALDRSLSAQMGKPHSIKEDFIIRNASNWWRNPLCAFADIALCSYVELQRILSRSLDFLYSGTSTASGLQTDCDYLLVTKTIETQIMSWNAEVGQRRAELGDFLCFPRHEFFVTFFPKGLIADRPDTTFRLTLKNFYLNYALLVINSFGLQNALERSRVDLGHFFARCYGAAQSVALIVRDELGPSGRLRYCTDTNFVQISYAVLSLLKYFRPEFRTFLENEQKTISLIKDVADLLEKVAAGPLHTPALYSSLLRALIAAKFDSTPATAPSTSASSIHNSDIQADGTPSENSAPNPNTLMSSGTQYQLLGLDNNIYQSAGEMGPAADISIFPPRMVDTTEETSNLLSMDSILSSDFWDNVLVPGYSQTLEGLSAGFVYGANGNSGYIASRLGSPITSIVHTPLMNSRPELVVGQPAGK
ncbi:hypothetical protein Clacol_006605 [Clathrus columnatus]|uniref:Xylanolytic transcriptional activator regulatory domain-containing protein n=1 Tax=Clathrus columnatus TaxID=1419009 RepID=A0AAV5AGS1_9AGAM|nr:hypothetical protein Clacol_006605 [Clathrus columnatus]